ncbi:MAG: 2OG-Fe(II) oxygenase [Pseudobdellovibrionaceae bacterium]|nr:2OG-Fe(II) oxygenase [Bdellovibrionales bacterium]USN47961.1 MAG: 2OG-Fe(II) oxygenase [Pseudobdellovibrionaceae bacterium]
MHKKNHWLVQDEFFPQAQKLRDHFESQFKNPRVAHENRFVWDYWHIPNQYTLVRTPAYHYFPEALYEELEFALISWGKKHLGCHEISPPWLSYYVDGCSQNLHADNPHGPWAFVFSLTPWENRQFTGGETLILQPQVLSYWENFDSERGFEETDLIKKIASPFNQLTVFDPRLPHGVSEVRGSKDPLDARLVIHGWFTEPRPYYEGDLSEEELQSGLQPQLDPLYDDLEELGAYNGVVTVRLRVSTTGQVEKLEFLTDTLKAIEQGSAPEAEIISTIKDRLATATFNKKRHATDVTLPFVFK